MCLFFLFVFFFLAYSSFIDYSFISAGNSRCAHVALYHIVREMVDPLYYAKLMSDLGTCSARGTQSTQSSKLYSLHLAKICCFK